MRLPPFDRLTELPSKPYRNRRDLVSSVDELPPIFEHPRTNPGLRRRRHFIGDPRWPECIELLASRVLSHNVGEALRAIALLKIRIRELEGELVVRTRKEGWPWRMIAWRLGVSEQAVRQRHRRREARDRAMRPVG